MAQLQTVTIQAPGFAGLNTQDSPVNMAPEYAAIASNCVIDQYGRVAARKGYNVLTSSEGPPTPVNMFYFEDSEANTQVYCTAADGVYSGTTTMSNVYSTSVTAGNYQMVQLDDTMFFVQAGHAPLKAVEGNAPTLASFTVDTTAATIDQPNVALAAFGRLWLADSSDEKSILWASALLQPETFNTGSNSARIDLDDVWPQGKDTITALAAHNGYLVIFGKHSIVIYTGATSPSTMTLHDTISGIGCVARDSIQSTGTDLIFLSAGGVRSLARTIQEESLPNRDISGTVRDDIVNRLSGDNSHVKSIYSPEEGFYALFFTNVDVAYVFDMRRSLPDGYQRATKWPSCPFKCMARKWTDGTLYVGGSEGVGTYSGYQDNGGTYTMSYYSHQINFGDGSKLKFLKKIRPVIIGTSSTAATLRWAYDFTGNYRSKAVTLDAVTAAEYGEAEFGEAEFGPAVGLNIRNINATGSGLSCDIGVTVTVDGSPFSIQELTIYATIGRVGW